VTSYRAATLIPAGIPTGNIEVTNEHGDIKLTMPSNSRFTLDAQTEKGQVKPIGFGSLNARGENLNAVIGADGPTIKLRTSYRNIVIQALGQSQVEASALVNDSR